MDYRLSLAPRLGEGSPNPQRPGTARAQPPRKPISDSTTLYEIFVSYVRKDHRPIPDTASRGWVTGLRGHIVADHRRFSTEPLRIFFDTEEIKDMDDWRHRILGSLRSSKILLVCLSPNFFASEPCRWEWEEYLKRQVHQLMGSDSIASVYFVEAKRLASRSRNRLE